MLTRAAPASSKGFRGHLARWLSPDPAGLAAVNPTDPQSWNRYAYVENEPLMLTDPTGLFGQGPVCSYSWTGLGWIGNPCPAGFDEMASGLEWGHPKPYSDGKPDLPDRSWIGPGVLIPTLIGPPPPPPPPVPTRSSCPSGPELTAGGSAGATAPFGPEITGQFDIRRAQPASGEKLQGTVSMNAGIPEAHAALFASIDQAWGPSVAYINMGVEALAKFTIQVPLSTSAPYINGIGFQVGAGVSAVGVQATITVPGITGCVGRP